MFVLLLLWLLTCSAQNTGESTNVIFLYIIRWKAVVHAIIVTSAFTRHFLLFSFSKRELELMTNDYFFDKIFFQFMDQLMLLLVGQLKRIPVCHDTRGFDLFHPSTIQVQISQVALILLNNTSTTSVEYPVYLSSLCDEALRSTSCMFMMKLSILFC